jgi:hypothetical protein
MWELFEDFQGLLDLMDGPDIAIAAAAIVALYHSFRDIAAVRHSPSIRCCSCMLVAGQAKMEISNHLCLGSTIVIAHMCACQLVHSSSIPINAAAAFYRHQQRCCACRIPSRRRPQYR